MKKAFLSAPLLATVLASSLLVGCGDKGATNTENTQTEAITMATLQGQAMFRERIMLPPGAQLVVTLENTDKAEVLSQQSLEVQGPPPFAFALQYDSSKIAQDQPYNLRIEIKDGDNVRFASPELIDPFSANLDPVLLRAIEQ